MGISDIRSCTTKLQQKFHGPGWECNGPKDKLIEHMLKATRRDETSEATIRAIKRLRPEKQTRLVSLAYQYLPKAEFDIFRKKISKWFERPTKIRSIYLKLPFGKLRAVQRDALRSLRDSL